MPPPEGTRRGCDGDRQQRAGVQGDSLVGLNKGDKYGIETKEKRVYRAPSDKSPGGEERAAGTGGNSALDTEIRLRAYQLYVERGGEHGRDLDDWLQAKREFESGALWPEQAN